MLATQSAGRCVTLVLLALVVFVSGSTAADDAGDALAAVESVYAFVGVNVVPMDREVILPDQTVIVRGDRIVAVGAADTLEVPADAVRIEGAGRYLMPGLADMHVHVWDEDHFWLFLANGITTVRNMWGTSLHQGWQAEIESGARIAPSIYTLGPLMDGPDAYWPGSTIVATPDEARETVAQLRQAGFAGLKVYDQLSAEVYAAIIEAAAQHEMRVEGHVPDAVGLYAAMRAGQLSTEHLTGFPAVTRRLDGPIKSEWDALSFMERRKAMAGVAVRIAAGESSLDDAYDPETIATVAADVAASSLWVVPTLVVFRPEDAASLQAAMAEPEMAFVDPSTRVSWFQGASRFAASLTPAESLANRIWHEYRLSVVRALHEAGAGLLLGSDTPNPFVVPGFSLHEELGYLIDSGLSPFAALRAGTSEAARFLDQSDEWGSVASGQRADLLLLADDPLADVTAVSRPLGVMARGHWMPAAFLQERLDGLARRYRGQDTFFAALSAGDVERAWALRSDYATAHDGEILIAEDGINGAGYMLLNLGRTETALELFTLNAQAYPESGNVWDSLGDATMRAGRHEQAIEFYEKSLAIDPANTNAVTKLAELRAQRR